MTDSEALWHIQQLLSSVEWSPDTLQDIADVMIAAGYTIDEYEFVGCQCPNTCEMHRHNTQGGTR